jgi:hypothetical protein
MESESTRNDRGITKSTTDWSYQQAIDLFPKHGCSTSGCEFHLPPDCTSRPGTFCCALNVSDALIRAGYTLPHATNVNYCPHDRVRNADGMARICNAQNGGTWDVSGWNNRPAWKGIVYFEGGTVTNHIDFWDGDSAVHTQFPDANTVWFWKLGT